MADISKVNIGGITYNIKDRQARLDIESLQSSVTGAMHYIGTTIDPTSIADNSTSVAYIKTGDATAIGYYSGTAPTTTTYTYNGVTYNVTYKELKAGDVVICGKLEFAYSDADKKWHEFGSTGSLKALAFKDTASCSYKPKGSVSSTFTGTAKTVKHTVTNSGAVSASGSFTPEGTVTQGTKTTASVVASYPGTTSKMVKAVVHDTPTAKTAALVIDPRLKEVTATTQKLVKTSIAGVSGSTTASKASAASVAGMTASVADETLTLTAQSVSFSNITVPVAATAVSVATGEVSATGTGSSVATGVTSTSGDCVIGVEGSRTDVVVGLEAGSEVEVATGALSTSGTGSAVMTGLGTPTTKTVLTEVGNPTFAGSEGTVNVTGTNSGVVVADHEITPEGTVESTFNGTEETITVQ